MAIAGLDGSVVAALSAEMITEAALTGLAGLAGSVPALAVTGRRAVVLGATEEAVGAVTLAVPAGLTAATARWLADPQYEGTLPADLTAEAAAPDSATAGAVALARLARLLPAALFAIVTAEDAAAWARENDAAFVTGADIQTYRAHGLRTLHRVVEARVPLAAAEDTRIVAFRPGDGGPEHLAIVVGEPDSRAPVLVRLHSECFTGDLLGSLRCDCGDQLRGALAEIGRAGSGVLLYLAQEGRGIGLVNKLRAYSIQDRGFDTVDANEILGFDADERVYLPAAEMLRQLGIAKVRLMTNNPDKLRDLARFGVEVVERVPHIFPSNGHNAFYLRTKAERSGHMF